MTTIEEAKQQLIEAAKKHPLYQNILKTKGKICIGRGNKKPTYLIIGEAPSFTENEKGLPFIGKSGQLINAWTALLKEPYAIINAVPIIPLNEKDETQIRKPTDEEIDYFRPYTQLLIKAIAPKYIICAGKTAAQMMKKNFRLCEWDQEENYEVGFIYHPSFFMRSGKNGLEEFEKLLKSQSKDENNYMKTFSYENLSLEETLQKFSKIIGVKIENG